jgi:hypothetical protein
MLLLSCKQQHQQQLVNAADSLDLVCELCAPL